MIKLKNIVNESPDTISPYGERMLWSKDDAIGFALGEDDKLYVTGWGEGHDVLYNKGISMSYDGRIWTKPKVVSFWDYPKPRGFVAIAKMLKDKIGVDILSDGWTIEVSKRGQIKPNYITTLKYGRVANKIENPSQQEYQKHLDRAKRDIPKGWGSKKTSAGLPPTQRQQIQMTSDSIIKLKSLVESPDEVYLGDGSAGLSVFDYDAYPFYYDLRKRKLYVANIPGDDHFSMQGTRGNAGLGHMIGGYHAKGDPNSELIYGRLWTIKRIISFWEYPRDSKDMKIVADALSDHFRVKKKKKINIWDDYDVEIYEDEDLGYNSSTYNVDSDYDLEPNEILPVKSYKKSYNPPDEELQQHLLSPADKKQIDVPANVGSKRTPSGLSATRRHQMQSTSEGLNEWADEVTFKKNNKDYMLDFEADDAIPFGYNHGTMEIGEIGEEHGVAGIPNNTPESYAGRLWFNHRVISFWIYPNTVAQLNKIVKDLNVTLKNYDEVLQKRIKITGNWKIDVPQFDGNHNLFNMFNVDMGDTTIDYDIHSDLVPIKDWHPDMISKAKDFKNKLQKKQQMHMLSPIAKRVTDMPNLGSKKTPAGLSSTRRHQMKSTSEIKESPDRVEATKDGRDVAFFHQQREGYVFGYFRKKFYIERESTHWYMEPKNVPREEYDYPGRIWTDEKIFSFWEYPKDADELYKIIRDIEKNTKIVVGENEWYIEVLIDDRSKEIIKNIMNDRGNFDNKLDKTSNAILIPIEKYEGSLDNDINIKHMIIPIMKSLYGMEVPKNWGSKKTPAGLSASQRHQVKYTSEIKESPDVVNSTKNGKHIEFAHGGRRIAYVFGYYENKLYIKDWETHIALEPKGVEREDYDYPGRLWTTEKIISFWIYPENKTKLYKIFKDINNSTDININPDDWYVDALLDADSKELIKRIISANGHTDYDLVEKSTAIMIPANEYVGSLDNDMNVKHMIIPIMKSLYGMEVPKNWGSKKTSAGLSASQIQQMRSTSEGLKEWADGFMMNGKSHDDYDDYDNTVVFGYDSHGNLVYDFGAVHDNIDIDTGDSALKRNYAGRVWIKEKVIGFWGYPESKEKLKQIVSDLNSEVKWLHINNGWKIDIPKPLLSKRYVKITKGNKFDYKYKKAFKHKDEDESVFIPIKDYDISLISKSPEAKQKKQAAMLQHMVSPLYKKTKSIAGIGSSKTPGGLSTAQRHQMKSTSENKD